MARHFAFMLFVLVSLFSGPHFATAQDTPIPEKRAVGFQDTDFPGNDIRPLFETTREICSTACADDTACVAITFNANNRSCFLKSSQSEPQNFVGAFSILYFELPPLVLERSRSNAQQLSFLPGGYLAQARNRLDQLAENAPLIDGYRTREDLQQALVYWRRQGNLVQEFNWSLKRQTLSYDPVGWLALSDLAWRLAKDDRKNQRKWVSYSADLATIAFLFADQPAQKAQAMVQLAQALERRGDGAATIPALRLAQAQAPTPDTAQRLERALGLFGFRVVENTTDNNAENPRICMTFSEALIEAGVDYTEYVRIQSGELPVVAEGRQLCIEGVAHGQSYAFTIRAGLPAASGEVTHKSADLTVYVKDRDPAVRFTGSGYVLPKSPTATIPLISVNTDQADLKIFRIGDRGLAAALRGDVLGSNLDGYDMSRIESGSGADVWSGTVDIASDLNANVITGLPVGDVLTTLQPGVYTITARVPDSDEFGEQAATQWFIVTDLGLETLSGDDGLHLFVRGLSDALPRAGVTARLVASNNEILGEMTTDQQGYVTFPAGLTRGLGGMTPALVTVTTEAGDYAFLDLTKAGFDLSDRGVEGLPPPKPIDIFLTTERGAYRPGETVHATVLARDATAAALDGLPLTAILSRADGVEFSREVLTNGQAGGFAYDMALPATAQRGAWALKIYADTKRTALAETRFLVEDFVPERIDFDINMADGAIAAKERPTVSVSADYLYGAPASGLNIEGELQVTPTNRLSDFPGYVFGAQEEAYTQSFAGIPTETTDADGQASFAVTLPEILAGSRPNTLEVTLRISDGSGRPVERSIERPIAPTAQLIGLKPLFDGALEEGALARFEVIALGTDAQRTALPDVQWTLSRISRDYQWYRSNGRWNWEPIERRSRVANGALSLSAESLGKIEAAVDWGEYELRLVSTSGAYATTSYTFDAGWWSGNGTSDTPDLLQVGLDRKAYAVGDTAKLRLDARYDGIALIRVLSNRLIAMQSIPVQKGETIVDLTVGSDWDSGAYVTATLIRPMDGATGRNPQRAIGLAYAPIDPGSKKLSATFETPTETNPRSRFDVALKVQGQSPGQPVFATIAAVDVGILNLTGFTSPAPVDQYFGQHRLGVEMRDLYGQLIDGSLGTRGTLRSGGDNAQTRGNAPPPTQDLVAEFSGILTVDDQGYARAQFDLPAFNGTVRLMAVVWSDSSVGQAEQDVLVRDPVVLTMSSPRFLAPGDQGRLLIEVAHATGPTGPVEVVLESSGPLALSNAAPIGFSLRENERKTLDIPLSADRIGTGEIIARLTAPDGREFVRTHVLTVRDNTPTTSRQHRVQLAGNGSAFEIGPDIFTDYVPGSGTAILTIGALAQIDAPGLLMQLNRYPYGCTEQLTSKALPLLYYGEVADALNMDSAEDLTKQINAAITTLLTRQDSSGAFGLWSAQGNNLWLDAFVTDFLSRARAIGYAVPDLAFTSALNNLQNKLNYAPDFENAGQDIAYALMVLAREGKASIGDLRYYADVKAQEFATPMALAQLGAGLAFYGDQARADGLFLLAQNAIDVPGVDTTKWRSDFGSWYRDTAAVLTLASEVSSTAVNMSDLSDRLAAASQTDLSTQDATWSLLAVRSAMDAARIGGVTVNGEDLGPTPVRRLNAQDLSAAPIIVENSGAQSTDLVLTTIGIPATEMPATNVGYRMERQLYTLEGAPVDLANIPLNTRMVAVLRVTPEREQFAHLMVADPLPAGFEIDNPNLLRAGDISSLSWLNLNTSAQFTEFRDDRFLAAVDWQGTDSFQLAYIVRAISPGTYTQPAASVEDMYRPNFRARTQAQRVDIRTE
ncbi:MAG: alpha-2-macroglobulin family protein [Marinosulfonomonas sp.]